MRRAVVAVLLIAALFGSGLAATGPAAGTASAADPQSDIRAVIERQIEAFRADDFETAFTFASPMIRRLFGTPSRFGEMVRNGYPMVWRPSDVRFSSLVTRDGQMVQSVLVRDAAGALHVLDYEMILGEDGWRINGVRLRRPGDAGA